MDRDVVSSGLHGETYLKILRSNGPKKHMIGGYKSEPEDVEHILLRGVEGSLT